MAHEIQRMSDSGGGSGSNGNPVGPPGQPPAPQQAPPPSPYTPPPAPAPAPYPAQPPPPQYGAPPQTPYPVPPQQQPPYQPPAYPQQQYGAPQTYAPPAPQAYQQQMQPGFAPAPARRGGSRTLMIVGIVAAFLVVVLAVGGFLANASFSSTYSAGKAVSAYFAAQSRGDVDYMFANANYLKGDSGTDAFFNRAAVAAMAGVKENKSVSGVTVTSTQQLDSSTSKVTASMSWNGNAVSETYTLHKDTTRTHFIFYNDWKLDIPANTISVTLPNQAGSVQIDGIAVPSGSSSVSVIQGFHTVTMQKTVLYDTNNQSVNAIDGAASVTFKSTLSATAMSAASDAIRAAFQPANITCDPNSDTRCPGHLYKLPAGYYETLHMPGGDVNANKQWIFNITGDPSSGMQLVVTTTAGKITASGTCTESLTVDGAKTYNYSGSWTGTLTANSDGSFGSDVTFGCDDAKA